MRGIEKVAGQARQTRWHAGSARASALFGESVGQAASSVRARHSRQGWVGNALVCAAGCALGGLALGPEFSLMSGFGAIGADAAVACAAVALWRRVQEVRGLRLAVQAQTDIVDMGADLSGFERPVAAQPKGEPVALLASVMLRGLREMRAERQGAEPPPSARPKP